MKEEAEGQLKPYQRQSVAEPEWAQSKGAAGVDRGLPPETLGRTLTLSFFRRGTWDPERCSTAPKFTKQA